MSDTRKLITTTCLVNFKWTTVLLGVEHPQLLLGLFAVFKAWNVGEGNGV